MLTFATLPLSAGGQARSVSPALQDATFDDDEQVTTAMMEMLTERCGPGPRWLRWADERGTNGRHRTFAALPPTARSAARRSPRAPTSHACLLV